jgi:hypothetical protein
MAGNGLDGAVRCHGAGQRSCMILMIQEFLFEFNYEELP